MTWEFIERKEAFDYIGLNNKSVNEVEQFLHGRVRLSAALFSNKKNYTYQDNPSSCLRL